MQKLAMTLPTLVVLAATGCEMPPETLPEPDAGGGERAVTTLVWTGSLQGVVTPWRGPGGTQGGLSRVATLVGQEREMDPDLLLVDIGDIAGDPREGEGPVDGTLERRERARVALEALGVMGYDALVPGERDLALGATRLRTWAAAAGVPLLATNVAFSDTNEPLGVVELWRDTPHGRMVVLALTTPPDQIVLDAAGEGHGRPVEVLDPETVLAGAIARVRSDAAHVTLLAHGERQWATDLLTAVPGVDLCLVAHAGEGPLLGPAQVGETFLLTTGRFGDYVGRVHINLAADRSYSLGGAMLEVSEGLAADPDVEALVGTLPARLNEAQARLEGASDVRDHPSGGVYTGWTECSRCHVDQGTAWQGTRHLAAFQSLQRIGWHVEPACFECHTTGFGWHGGFESRGTTPRMGGVSCEACHGPGDTDSHDRPGYGRTDEALCRDCHTAEVDPDFDYAAAYGEIQHGGGGVVRPPAE